MLPVKKILCPCDFSDPSFMDLTVADELARHFDADLFILHVVASVPPLYYTAPVSAELYADFDVQKYQKNLVDEAYRRMESSAAERIAPEVKAHKVVLNGDAPYQIVEYAKLIDADLHVFNRNGFTPEKAASHRGNRAMAQMLSTL